MSLVWPTKFANTLNFYTKQIRCLRIYEECLKILILGKLVLKLVFLKNFASHTHAYESYFSMLGGFYAKTGLFFQNWAFFWNFDRSRLFFDQSKLVQNFLVSLYLFRSIEPKVLINQKWYKTFFKTRFSDESNTFSKKILPSLSIRLSQGTSPIFCHFLSFFLQGFPLPRPVCPFYPSFCILFHVFTHKFMVFR